MADEAVAFTTFCWGIAALAALWIAVPQSVLLIRTCARRDTLWWFRLKSTLLFGSLSIAMIRNMVVWADYRFFDSGLLGKIDERWPIDLTISVAVMVSCVLAAVLYWQVNRKAAD